jgi:hypothetical protein
VLDSLRLSTSCDRSRPGISGIPPRILSRSIENHPGTLDNLSQYSPDVEPRNQLRRVRWIGILEAILSGVVVRKLHDAPHLLAPPMTPMTDGDSNTKSLHRTAPCLTLESQNGLLI